MLGKRSNHKNIRYSKNAQQGSLDWMKLPWAAYRKTEPRSYARGPEAAKAYLASNLLFEAQYPITNLAYL